MCLPKQGRRWLSGLREAVRRGSSEAARDLRGVDPALYEIANGVWEKRFCQLDPDNMSKITGMDDLEALCRQLNGRARHE